MLMRCIRAGRDHGREMTDTRHLHTEYDHTGQTRFSVLYLSGLDDEYGPSMAMWQQPDGPVSAPMAVTETHARALIAGMQEGLRIIEQSMPDLCAECGEHCKPRDEGLCWRCQTQAEMDARKALRGSLKVLTGGTR